MALVADFTFNPFQENTYLLYDDTKECIIVDPGCYTQEERDELDSFIQKNGLKPVRLLNTHCHLDHVFGNGHVHRTYNLPLEIHQGELPVLKAVPNISSMYGIAFANDLPEPGRFIEAGEEITFGNTTIKALLTPGHSPASLSFYCADSGWVIAGDVLFYGSIGRTDLPGGNYDTLIDSVRSQLFTLPDETQVWPGHGPKTSIGFEKQNNPFFR